MVVTETQIIPVKPKNGLIAFASCVIDNQLYLGDIAIYTSPSSSDGYRLTYPMKVLPNGKRINCVHPINRESGKLIHMAIIDKLRKFSEKVTKAGGENNAK